MKRKLTILLLGLAPCLVFAQSPVGVYGPVNIGNGGNLLSQGTVTVNSNASQGTGVIVNSGTLGLSKGIIFKSDDSNDGLLANKSIVSTTGSAISEIQLQKTFTDKRYYYVSFPFTVKMNTIQSATGAILVYDKDYYIMEYDAASRPNTGKADSWKDLVVDAKSTLVPGKGYLFALDEEVVNREVIFPASDITNLFSTATANKTINLSYYTPTIQNPFTTALSWGWNFTGGLTTSNYTMNQSNLNYTGFLYYYNKSVKDYVEIATGLGQSTTMPPYISFFTHEAQAGNSIAYSVGGVTTSTQSANLRSEEEPQFDIISLWINGSEYNDQLRIVTGDSYPENLDYHKDAPKLFSPDKETPQLWSMLEGDELCITMLPKKEYREVTLGVKTGEDDNYTISLDEGYNGFYQSIVLFDKETGERTNLLTDSYTFPSTELNTTDRFTLELNRMPTSIDNAQADKVIIYASNHQLFVKNIQQGDKIQVFDVTGRMVLSATAQGSDFTGELETIGALIIKVTGNTNKTAKIINQ